MAKKPSKSKGDPGAFDLATFLQGEIVDQNLDRMAHHAHALQLMVRSGKAKPNPSVGACTPKGICTVTILCLITKSPRITCGASEVFNPDCPITIKV
jgi:hypothetical protein